MMPAAALSAQDRIESALASYFGRKHCRLANRGTTALAAALSALGRPGDIAVFPAAMCSIPVFSAAFAGWKPRFADVNFHDGNFDLISLESVLKAGAGRVGAVVPIHAYGKPDDLEALQFLCDKYGAALLEDGALSMGAVYKGVRAGSFGKLTAVSFVRKMLPLEMGGAVLTDDPVLDLKAGAFLHSLPKIARRPEETGRLMKDFHLASAMAARSDWEPTASLLPAYEGKFREHLLCSTTGEDWENSIVLEELAGLEQAIQARRKRAEVYETVLSHPRIVPLANAGSCFFAYPVRLAGVDAEDFLAYARNKGYSFKRVAYPDIHPIFGPKGQFPGAAVLEKELVGLAADDNQPLSHFWSYAQDFQDTFEKYLDSGPSASDWRGALEMRMSA